jgi:hypothetical protein
MKKVTFQLSFCLALLLPSTKMSAQTIATFENLPVPSVGYWNGSDAPNGTSFTDGNVIFPNVYAGYWASGWAYSNQIDISTAGYTNLYSASAGAGADGSVVYAVGQRGAVMNFNGASIRGTMNGFYVTNGTYAALSMLNGDDFAKKFGGPEGTDPDFFKLTVKGWFDGFEKSETVEFYLADFRFPNSEDDYIVTDWRWVDLTPIGNVDSLVFDLESSDNDPQFGMNTPGFFCLDNFSTMDDAWGIAEQMNQAFNVYPNPDNITDIETLEDMLTCKSYEKYKEYKLLNK